MKQNIKHIIILVLALMATIGAEATTKVVTYTMTMEAKSTGYLFDDYYYYLQSSSGERLPLNADINNSYSLPKTFTLHFADVNITVTSSGDKGHIARSTHFFGFAEYTYTFTFESTDYFVTHVRVSSHSQYTQYVDAYSLTKSCSATWDWDKTHEYVHAFEVTLVDRFDISTVTVGGINASYDYTGSAIKPEPTSVTYTLNGQSATLTATLTKNTDYTIGYSNNTNAGTATMTLTGIGDYCGTKSHTFTINPVAANVTAPTAKTNLTYSGSAQALCTAGSCTGGTFRYSTNNGSSWTTTVPKATNAGTYTLWYKFDADANHTGSIAKTSLGTVTIAQAAALVSAPAVKTNLTYNGSAQALCTAGSRTGGTLYYSTNNGSSWTTTVPTATNAGDYTLWYKFDADANHTGSIAKTSLGTVTIAQAAALVSAPAAKTNLTYNGSAQALCTAGSRTSGTLYYSTDNGSSWTTTVPTATNAGDYTLCYKLDADANHVSIAKTSLGTVSVAARERTFGNIRVTETGVAVTTTAVIADGTDEITIPQDITVGGVTFNRTFTVDASSTVMLPFSIAVSKVSGGKFYGFVGVDKNTDGWEVVMQEVDPSGTLQAHTPYLFKPSATQMTFNLGGETVTLKANTQSTYSTIIQ